ncbi:MAG: type II toxin-antitoxin system Phd/YefM family antitoxin [Candidatus Moduliflexus flocculans]|nr:type II toxin-antitoxin system Phd/YefM family antitoxin [Candidatus Moduliflexus flocculans]
MKKKTTQNGRDRNPRVEEPRSEVVRAVKEERARYVITQRGKPAALIIPLDAALPEKKMMMDGRALLAIQCKAWQGERE